MSRSSSEARRAALSRAAAAVTAASSRGCRRSAAPAAPVRLTTSRSRSCWRTRSSGVSEAVATSGPARSRREHAPARVFRRAQRLLGPVLLDQERGQSMVGGELVFEELAARLESAGDLRPDGFDGGDRLAIRRFRSRRLTHGVPDAGDDLERLPEQLVAFHLARNRDRRSSAASASACRPSSARSSPSA